MPIKTWQNDLQPALVWFVGHFSFSCHYRLIHNCLTFVLTVHGLLILWRQAGPEDGHITHVEVLPHPCKSLGITGTGWALKRGRGLSPVAKQLMAEWRLGLGGSAPLFLLFLITTQGWGSGKVCTGLKKFTINTRRETVSLTRGGEVKNPEIAKLKPPNEWRVFGKSLWYIKNSSRPGVHALGASTFEDWWAARGPEVTGWLIKWNWGSC